MDGLFREARRRSLEQGKLIAFLLGLLLVSLFPSAASAASACKGRNGELAVSMNFDLHPNVDSIGIIRSEQKVRPLFSRPVIFGSYPSSPSFSCNGSEIVYQEEREEPCGQLEIVKLNGVRRELRAPHLCPTDPAFLANGKIVFNASREAGPSGDATYMTDADGSHRHRIFEQAQLAASADGRSFVTYRGHALVLSDANGKPLHRLSPNLPGNNGQYLHPSFSPDGRWIAYEREIFTHAYRPNPTDLFIVRRDGSHRQRLTRDERSGEPCFSPDGRWIAFIRRPQGDQGAGGSVFALSVKHPSNIKALTHAGGSQAFQYPTWATR